MTFPQIVGALMGAGFQSYVIDFRRKTATYYLPDGESVVLTTHRADTSIATEFEAAAVQAAIKEAQQLVLGFCNKIMAAGCAATSCPSRAAGRCTSAAPRKRMSSASRSDGNNRRRGMFVLVAPDR
jgi:hypothetical protein